MINIVAITGHTSGIGLGLKIYLESNGSTIYGFSRTNGYDISKFDDRLRIINQAANCDLFINNAYNDFCQTELFIEWFKRYHLTNKTIINVGSNVTEHFLAPARHDLLKYQACKLLLKETSTKLVSKCTVKYKTFGYVGTEKILEKYPNLTEKNYITIDQAVKIILA